MKDYFLSIFKEKKSYCIIGVIALLVILAIMIVVILMPKNVENFSGNLINNGFALKLGNKIYCLKQDGIYKTNSEGDEAQRIFEGSALYLNLDGKFIYFIEKSNEQYNLVKMKTNSKNKQIVIENIDGKMISVKENWIYFLQDDDFYKIKTNGKDKIKLLDKEVENYQINGNNIYYACKDGVDCIIAKMKIDGTEIVNLDTDCNPNFYVSGNKIYYIKEEYNSEKYEYEYTLCEMKENGNKKEITKLPNTIKQINMAKDKMYYLTTEDYEKYELYEMDYKGNNKRMLAETSLNTKINVIGKDVYYMDLINNNGVAVYRINVKNMNKQEL